MKLLVVFAVALGALAEVKILESGNVPEVVLQSANGWLSKLDFSCDFYIKIKTSPTSKAFTYETHQNTLTLTAESGLYQTYGLYYLLEEVFGYSFLHPLETAYVAVDYCKGTYKGFKELPYWEVRGIHIHTEHPLEHVELLNGFGKFPSTENWEDQLGEWNRVVEWCIANGLNYLEWVLLQDKPWESFSQSPLRQARLAKLVEVAHSWGLKVGIDTPVAMTQQHAFSLIRNKTNPLQQIEQRINYLAGANFDYISSEIGTTEYTHGSATEMLKWLNYSTIYAKSKGMDFYSKAHCSRGQQLENFVDPLTNKTGMDYNFLPYYAVEDLGVMPHTVEFYSLEDPAPVYGNQNFTYMLDFMMLEASKRKTIWFPETAYWVTFDINVPLFLPIYLKNRIKDIQTVAREETKRNVKLEGQIFFASGWEFGYWMNNFVTARLAWDPLLTSKDPLKDALKPFTKVVGNQADQVSSLISELCQTQEDTLIFGKVDGKPPKSLDYLTGIAYLEGWDTFETWAYVADIALGQDLGVMPNRISPQLVRHGLDTLVGASYIDEIAPLLSYQSQVYSDLAKAFGKITVQSKFYQEVKDSVQIFANRAVFNQLLFEYAAALRWGSGYQEPLEEMLTLLNQTQVVIDRRVQNFRVPAERIASWRKTPAAYCYTYLWPAASLYYWWRDLLVVYHNYLSPCHYNVRDIIEEGMGSGTLHTIVHSIYEVFKWVPFDGWINDCLGCPDEEPKYGL